MTILFLDIKIHRSLVSQSLGDVKNMQKHVLAPGQVLGVFLSGYAGQWFFVLSVHVTDGTCLGLVYASQIHTHSQGFTEKLLLSGHNLVLQRIFSMDPLT